MLNRTCGESKQVESDLKFENRPKILKSVIRLYGIVNDFEILQTLSVKLSCKELLQGNLHDVTKRTNEKFHFYKGTGMTGLELVIDLEPKNINVESSPQEIITELGRRALEEVFYQSLDYQSLIDSNWRCLYNSKTDWAKFIKIAIFLYIVKRYRKEIEEAQREQ